MTNDYAAAPETAISEAASFRRLLSSQAGTFFGDALLTAALPLIALRVTRSPILISSVALSGSLPWIIVSLPSGLLVDQFERRRLLGTSCVTASIFLAALAIALGEGVDNVILIDIVAFFVGSLQILTANTGSALVPQVVSPDNLSAANAKFFAAQGVVGQLFGPPLAAVLVTVGLALPIVAAMCSYTLAAIVILSWRQTFRAATAPMRWSVFHRDLGVGLVILARNRQLLTFCAMTALLNLADQAVLSVLVLYVVSPGRMNLPKAAYGLLLAAIAVGGIIGTRLAGPVTRVFGRGRALAGVLVIIAVALGLPALWPQPIAVGAEFMINGAASAVYNIITVSYRQRVIQPTVLGRVTAAYRLFGYGALPLGSLVGGVAAHLFGVAIVFPIGAVISGLALAGLPFVREQLLKAAEAESARVE